MNTRCGKGLEVILYVAACAFLAFLQLVFNAASGHTKSEQLPI